MVKPRHQRGSIRHRPKPESDDEADLSVFAIVLKRKRKQPDEAFKTLKPRKFKRLNDDQEFKSQEETEADKEARAKVEKLRSSGGKSDFGDGKASRTRMSQSSSSRRSKANADIADIGDSDDNDDDDDGESIGSSLSFSSREESNPKKRRGGVTKGGAATRRRSLRLGSTADASTIQGRVGNEEETQSEADESNDSKSSDGSRGTRKKERSTAYSIDDKEAPTSLAIQESATDVAVLAKEDKERDTASLNSREDSNSKKGRRVETKGATTRRRSIRLGSSESVTQGCSENEQAAQSKANGQEDRSDDGSQGPRKSSALPMPDEKAPTEDGLNPSLRDDKKLVAEKAITKDEESINPMDDKISGKRKGGAPTAVRSIQQGKTGSVKNRTEAMLSSSDCAHDYRKRSAAAANDGNTLTKDQDSPAIQDEESALAQPRVKENEEIVTTSSSFGDADDVGKREIGESTSVTSKRRSIRLGNSTPVQQGIVGNKQQTLPEAESQGHLLNDGSQCPGNIDELISAPSTDHEKLPANEDNPEIQNDKESVSAQATAMAEEERDTTSRAVKKHGRGEEDAAQLRTQERAASTKQACAEQGQETLSEAKIQDRPSSAGSHGFSKIPERTPAPPSINEKAPPNEGSPAIQEDEDKGKEDEEPVNRSSSSPEVNNQGEVAGEAATIVRTHTNQVNSAIHVDPSSDIIQARSKDAEDEPGTSESKAKEASEEKFYDAREDESLPEGDGSTEAHSMDHTTVEMTVNSKIQSRSLLLPVETNPVSSLWQKMHDEEGSGADQVAASSALMVMVTEPSGGVESANVDQVASPDDTEKKSAINDEASKLPASSNVDPVLVDDVAERTVVQEDIKYVSPGSNSVELITNKMGMTEREEVIQERTADDAKSESPSNEIMPTGTFHRQHHEPSVPSASTGTEVPSGVKVPSEDGSFIKTSSYAISIAPVQGVGAHNDAEKGELSFADDGKQATAPVREELSKATIEQGVDEVTSPVKVDEAVVEHVSEDVVSQETADTPKQNAENAVTADEIVGDNHRSDSDMVISCAEHIGSPEQVSQDAGIGIVGAAGNGIEGPTHSNNSTDGTLANADSVAVNDGEAERNHIKPAAAIPEANIEPADAAALCTKDTPELESIDDVRAEKSIVDTRREASLALSDCEAEEDENQNLKVDDSNETSEMHQNTVISTSPTVDLEEVPDRDTTNIRRSVEDRGNDDRDDDKDSSKSATVDNEAHATLVNVRVDTTSKINDATKVTGEAEEHVTSENADLLDEESRLEQTPTPHKTVEETKQVSCQHVADQQVDAVSASVNDVLGGRESESTKELSETFPLCSEPEESCGQSPDDNRQKRTDLGDRDSKSSKQDPLVIVLGETAESLLNRDTKSEVVGPRPQSADLPLRAVDTDDGTNELRPFDPELSSIDGQGSVKDVSARAANDQRVAISQLFPKPQQLIDPTAKSSGEVFTDERTVQEVKLPQPEESRHCDLSIAVGTDMDWTRPSTHDSLGSVDNKTMTNDADASAPRDDSAPETKGSEDVVAADEPVLSEGQALEPRDVTDKSRAGAIELSSASVVEVSHDETFDALLSNGHSNERGSFQESLQSGEVGVLVNEETEQISSKKDAVSVVKGKDENRADDASVASGMHTNYSIEEEADDGKESLTKETDDDHNKFTISSSVPRSDNGQPLIDNLATETQSSPGEQNAAAAERSSTKRTSEDRSELTMLDLEPSVDNSEPCIDESVACSSPPSNANFQGTMPAKRSRDESPQPDEGNKRLCSRHPTVAQIPSDGDASRFDAKSADHDVTAIKTTSRRLDLDRVKLAIYEVGKRVHKGKQCDILFMQYWAAISLKLSGNLSSTESGRNQLIIKRFLKSKALRMLHNKLILGLLERCVKRDFTESDIPSDAISRVSSVVKLKQCRKPLKTTKFTSAASIIPEPLVGPQNQETKLGEGGQDSINDHSSSSRIPGALLIDPYVRAMAQAQGLRVNENSLWLVVVAAKEYATRLLSDCLATAKALESSSAVGTMKVRSLPLLLSQADWNGKADGSAQKQRTASEGPRTKSISSLQVHAVLSRMPIAVRSLSGCVSRMSYERSVRACQFGMQGTSRETVAFEYVRGFCFSKIAPLPQQPKDIAKPVEADRKSASVDCEPQSVASSANTSTGTGDDVPGSGKCIVPEPDSSKGLGGNSKDLSALVARSSPEAPPETSASTTRATATTTNVTKVPSSDGATTSQAHSVDGSMVQAATTAVPRSPGKGAGTKNLAAMRARSTVEESLTTKEELQPVNVASEQPPPPTA